MCWVRFLSFVVSPVFLQSILYCSALYCAVFYYIVLRCHFGMFQDGKCMNRSSPRNGTGDPAFCHKPKCSRVEIQVTTKDTTRPSPCEQASWYNSGHEAHVFGSRRSKGEAFDKKMRVCNLYYHERAGRRQKQCRSDVKRSTRKYLYTLRSAHTKVRGTANDWGLRSRTVITLAKFSGPAIRQRIVQHFGDQFGSRDEGPAESVTAREFRRMPDPRIVLLVLQHYTKDGKSAQVCGNATSS